MTAQPVARLCKVGKNLLKRQLPKTYPQWKIDLGKEITTVFDRNSKVLILHYNALNSQEWNDFRYDMRKENVMVKMYPNKITNVYLAKTIYSNLSVLFHTDTCIAYGGDDINMKGVLKHLKTHQKVHLIGAKIENILMNYEQVLEYSKLPSLEHAHAELVHILSQPSTQLSNLLQSNQSNLSMSLEQYIKQESNDL